MEEIFKKRLYEEIKHSGKTVKEIADLIGVTPEMVNM